jgi:hypothetical protein
MSAAERPVLLFLHLPKTAGTTFTRLIYAEQLERNPNWEGWIAPRFHFAYGVLYLRENASYGFYRDSYESAFSAEDLAVLRRPDVEVISGHFTYGLHRFLDRPAVYITILRDPVDRVLSLYHHLRSFPDDYPLNKQVGEGMTISEFVGGLRRTETDNDQLRRLVGRDVPFGGCTQEMLEEATETLDSRFLSVGLTERFDESVAVFGNLLGWAPRTPYSMLVNHGRPGREAISDAELEAIESHNALDAELYDEARRRFEQQLQAESRATVQSQGS